MNYSDTLKPQLITSTAVVIALEWPNYDNKQILIDLFDGEEELYKLINYIHTNDTPVTEKSGFNEVSSKMDEVAKCVKEQVAAIPDCDALKMIKIGYHNPRESLRILEEELETHAWQLMNVDATQGMIDTRPKDTEGRAAQNFRMSDKFITKYKGKSLIPDNRFSV